jgi:hypothetical protein
VNKHQIHKLCNRGLNRKRKKKKRKMNPKKLGKEEGRVL